MGARAESLAKQFETKAAEMTSVIKGLSDADWKKTTDAEKWSVGVTAHHVARGHEAIAGIVKTLASGQSLPMLGASMRRYIFASALTDCTLRISSTLSTTYHCTPFAEAYSR